MKWMRARLASAFTALIFALALLAKAQAPNGSLSAADQKTIDSFLGAAKAYLAIEQSAPSQAKLKPTNDIAELNRRRRALREFMIAARPNAKQGDLFTPPVADLFRKLMAQAMDGPDGNEIRRSLQNAEPLAAEGAPQIAVNHDYPNQKGQPLQSSPGSLLKNLPILPRGLEYRKVGDILVLRDAVANLVVDYLPDAFH